MTYKDLFTVLIKIFALQYLVYVLSAFTTSFVGSLGFSMNSDYYWNSILIVISFVLQVAVLLFVLARANRLVKLLKLSQGFEENRIDWKGLKANHILKLGIFVTGGLLFINTLPSFLAKVLNLFHENLHGNAFVPDHEWPHLSLGFETIKLLISYLLITNFNRIANRFQSQIEMHTEE